MPGTCSTCGSALHSDLSRLHGKCGPCRWGDEAHAEPTWRRLVREEPQTTAPPNRDQSGADRDAGDKATR